MRRINDPPLIPYLLPIDKRPMKGNLGIITTLLLVQILWLTSISMQLNDSPIKLKSAVEFESNFEDPAGYSEYV